MRWRPLKANSTPPTEDAPRALNDDRFNSIYGGASDTCHKMMRPAVRAEARVDWMQILAWSWGMSQTGTGH
jgi:hypothetical protein